MLYRTRLLLFWPISGPFRASNMLNRTRICPISSPKICYFRTYLPKSFPGPGSTYWGHVGYYRCDRLCAEHDGRTADCDDHDQRPIVKASHVGVPSAENECV